MTDLGINESSNYNRHQNDDASSCEAIATCQVLVLGAQRIRVAKILALLQSVTVDSTAGTTIRSAPEPPPFNGTHHILTTTSENGKEFHVKVEFLPCVATFDSYENERGEQERSLSSVQYHGIDGKQRGSSLAPFFDSVPSLSTKGECKKLTMNQNWGIIAAVAGCGIELQEDVERIQQFLNIFIARQDEGTESIDESDQRDKKDSCALRVTLIKPNPPYSSMKEENEALKGLNSEEKDQLRYYGSLMGPGKMAHFVVKETEKAIKERLPVEKHEESTSPVADASGSGLLADGAPNQLNPFAPINDQTKEIPDAIEIPDDVVTFACKICRRVLFHESDLQDPPHDKSRHSFSFKTSSTSATGKSCESIFLAGGLAWMGDMSGFEGKFHCPKCATKIGHWNWSGAQCSCGTWSRYNCSDCTPVQRSISSCKFCFPRCDVNAAMLIKCDSRHIASVTGLSGSTSFRYLPWNCLNTLVQRLLQTMPITYKIAEFQALSANHANIKGKRSVVCEKDRPVFSNNIHVDSRVVRGNTYATPVVTEEQKRNKAVFERARRSLFARKVERPSKTIPDRKSSAVGTPPPIEGRQHLEIQTETYWEELNDGPTECSISAQTDDCPLNRPLSPVFIPILTDDKEAQTGDAEIYAFDLELTSGADRGSD